MNSKRFSFEGIVRFRCRTRRHIWIEEEDAEKCCDPRYMRCTEVNADGSIVRFFWLAVDAGSFPSPQQESTTMPKCPKCGATTEGGAPHGPWPIQYECPKCRTIVVPPSK